MTNTSITSTRVTTGAPVALITGAAQRIGSQIARSLHERGFRIIIHYRQSEAPARTLSDQLNQLRPDSAACCSADFAISGAAEKLAATASAVFGRIDVLVNNASDFYPTSVGQISESDFDTLFASNLRAPLFLSQALAPQLKTSKGCIINIADIYADRPLKNHTVYSCAKASVSMLTKSLALELAPDIRVNAIAPGAILLPSEASDFSVQEEHNIHDRVPLRHIGEPLDIARTAVFLVCDAPYITGQIIAVDGGRTLTQ